LADTASADETHLEQLSQRDAIARAMRESHHDRQVLAQLTRV
jgi:hypothetical protein